MAGTRATPRTGRLSRSSAVARHPFLPLLAEAGDAEGHDVPRLEVHRLGLHAQTHARRRARGDEIARKQRHVLREIRHELGDAEDHGARIAALTLLAVHVQPHVEILRILDLVGGHQARPDRSEGIATLALAPLSAAALHLILAFGNVVDDAVAGDVLEA